MQYNKKCSCCGRENRVYLDETDGWFICSRCDAEVDTKEAAAYAATGPPKALKAG